MYRMARWFLDIFKDLVDRDMTVWQKIEDKWFLCRAVSAVATLTVTLATYGLSLWLIRELFLIWPQRGYAGLAFFAASPISSVCMAIYVLLTAKWMMRISEKIVEVESGCLRRMN